MPISDYHNAATDPPRFSEDIDSTCSTPFVSAPSSPGHGPSGYFYSAPASPIHHYLLSKEKAKASFEPVFLSSDSGSFEFEFSSRFSANEPDGIVSMTSADELFFNGQIRPMKLSSHLQRPQENNNVDPEGSSSSRGRDLRVLRTGHRKARSMSPFRTTTTTTNHHEWRTLATTHEIIKEDESSETTPSCSASSSRSSSSSGRNSKKWIFLKDLLHRSKSEGGSKERFWSFSPAKEKKAAAAPSTLSPSSSRDGKGKGINVRGKPANGVWRRPSAHEVHYTTNRAQAEEMKRKTFLPYRQGLLGCLGFSSKSYGAFSGFTKNLNPISSSLIGGMKMKVILGERNGSQ